MKLRKINNKTCECEICKNKLPFEMPSEIIEAILNGELVLFAGAGISTENNSVFKETLYQDILEDVSPSDNKISFPKLMSLYCSSVKNGRQKLLEKIKSRFDYCHQFNELYRSASGFHRELAPFWMIKNIITTNWDDYFERECNATPIVTSEDFVFYNINHRKVFKIHGSISNYGSIVATERDYEECYKRLNSGLVGASLKTLLATKTILFVGYSFTDFDFRKILNLLKKEMGKVLPHIYIVTLDDSTKARLNGFDSTIIKTDGRFFFEKLRKHFENKDLILPEENIIRLYSVEYLRNKAHKLMVTINQKKKNPSLVHCLIYQDGVQHAIDCLIFKAKSGEAYNPYYLVRQVDNYEAMKKKLIKNKNYNDLAYVEGYIEGLKIPLLYKSPKDFPLFFLFGIGPINDSTFFTKSIRSNKVFHKQAEAYGRKYYKKYLNSDLIIHHRPFI